jgi:hypothetical protein
LAGFLFSTDFDFAGLAEVGGNFGAGFEVGLSHLEALFRSLISLSMIIQ